MKKSRNLNQWTFLFYSLLGIALIACEKEDFQINEDQAALLMEEDLLDDQASPSRWTSDDRNYGAIATFGGINGKIGKIIDAQRTVAKEKINSFADYSTDKAAFIYVDLDEFPYQGETSIKDFIYDAHQVNASLIFESGTRNQKKFNELGFFTEEIPCGIVVLENSKNSKQSLLYYLPDTLSDASLINRLSMHPVKDINEISLRSNGSPSIELIREGKRCCRRHPRTKKCLSYCYDNVYIKATNTIYLPEDNNRWEYRMADADFSAVRAQLSTMGETEYEIIKPSLRSCSSENTSDTGPRFLCGVSCSFDERVSYTNSYSLGMKLGGKFNSGIFSFLKELTFEANASIGRSKTEGTASGISIDMDENNVWFATANVIQQVYGENEGYFTGNATYTVQRRKKSGSKRHWRSFREVKVNLVNFGPENNWKGMQPLKSPPFLAWNIDLLRPDEYKDACD